MPNDDLMFTKLDAVAASIAFLYRCVIALMVITVLQFSANVFILTRARLMLRSAGRLLELAAKHGKVSDEKLDNMKTQQAAGVSLIGELISSKAEEIKANVPPKTAEEVVKKAGLSGDGLIPAAP